MLHIRITSPNYQLQIGNNGALISSNIITYCSHLMTAVTVGRQEQNDQSVVLSMPFTSTHQRRECSATHSILAGWFNPVSLLTGSKHYIHHILPHVSILMIPY